ncbi:MAG TPA: NADPH-dependent FMN reductase [Stellaceae bacterium]|nr:NADPH-dependent FMN reductase [Stellaceae bacterium]
MSIRIIGIPGSIRPGSYNVASLHAAAAMLPQGASLDIVGIEDVPVYSEVVLKQGFPDGVKRFRERAQAADAVLFASPEYNYSISASLKAALEWSSRPPDPPLGGKPCAIMGASTSPLGTLRGQSHLRQVCVSLNLVPLNAPTVDIADAQKKFDAAGNLTDAATRDLIRQLVTGLVEVTLRFKAART